MTQITTKSPAYVSARTKLGDHRKIFDSATTAIETLRAIYATDGFPQEFPTVAAGVGLVDVTGEDTIPPFDKWPEAYSLEGVSVCVTFIGVRKIETADGPANGAAGFAIYPLFSLEAINAEESGPAWLWKIIEKEASHVALRGLRNQVENGTDALAAAAMQMPQTASEYVSESEREGTDTSAFDAIWKQFRTMLANSPATASLVPALRSKSDVLKAIRYKSYAVQEFPELEEIGAFVFIAETMGGIIDHMRQKAIEEGTDFDLDSSEIRGWLATRDTKVHPAARQQPADLKKVDFGAFLSGLQQQPQA